VVLASLFLLAASGIISFWGIGINTNNNNEVQAQGQQQQGVGTDKNQRIMGVTS
jgi:hypothetical protein